MFKLSYLINDLFWPLSTLQSFSLVREILIPEAAMAAKNGPTAAHEVIYAFKFILLGTFWIRLTFWASPGKRAKARFWLIHFSPYAVCASAPLTSWAIGAGGIFKTPPSGGLLLTLSLASVMVGWQSNLQSCEDSIEKPWFSTPLFPSSFPTGFYSKTAVFHPPFNSFNSFHSIHSIHFHFHLI